MVYSTVFFMFALQTNKLRKMIPAVSENEALKNALADVERAKQEAERANAAKSRFLSRMSHDIRTPLNGIIGILEINSKCHDEQIEQENRDKAMVAANHLLSLINDVLEMSKLEDENTRLLILRLSPRTCLSSRECVPPKRASPLFTATAPLSSNIRMFTAVLFTSARFS